MHAKIRLFDAVCVDGKVNYQRLCEFAEEISCSITSNPAEFKWYNNFLLVAVYYVFAECNIPEQTFSSLLKLAKASKRDEDDEKDISVFEVLLDSWYVIGNNRDLIANLKKNFKEISANRPQGARKALEKVFNEYQRTHEIDVLRNDLRGSAFFLFENFTKYHSMYNQTDEFDLTYEYTAEAIRIANEAQKLTDEGRNEMLRSIEKIHVKERPVNYKVLKITDMNGNDRSDGRYPLRVGRILRPLEEFSEDTVGKTADWLWLTGHDRRDVRYHTSPVQMFVITEDETEVHTVNSVYHLKKL